MKPEKKSRNAFLLKKKTIYILDNFAKKLPNSLTGALNWSATAMPKSTAQSKYANDYFQSEIVNFQLQSILESLCLPPQCKPQCLWERTQK